MKIINKKLMALVLATLSIGGAYASDNSQEEMTAREFGLSVNAYRQMLSEYNQVSGSYVAPQEQDELSRVMALSIVETSVVVSDQNNEPQLVAGHAFSEREIQDQERLLNEFYMSEIKKAIETEESLLRQIHALETYAEDSNHTLEDLTASFAAFRTQAPTYDLDEIRNSFIEEKNTDFGL